MSEGAFRVDLSKAIVAVPAVSAEVLAPHNAVDERVVMLFRFFQVLIVSSSLLASTIGDANASHLGTPHGWSVSWRKLKNFLSQCRANGGTVVQSSYGAGVYACRLSNGRTRFCQAISSTQIQCWSDQTLPPPRPGTPEHNNQPADMGGGNNQSQPAPTGPTKGNHGCSGGVC
jgi:hypothetical protein